MTQTLRQPKERKSTIISDSVLGKPVSLAKTRGLFSRTIEGGFELKRDMVLVRGRKFLFREPIFDVTFITNRLGIRRLCAPGAADVADVHEGSELKVHHSRSSSPKSTCEIVQIIGKLEPLRRELADRGLTEALALLNHIALHLGAQS